MLTPEEIAASGDHRPADVAEALRVVHTLDPAGVGAADLRECLLLQLESRGGKGGVAWQIVADHLKLVELRQFKELARVLHRPHRTYPDRHRRDPASGSAARPALFRSRARGRWSRTSTFPRTATIT